MGEEVAAMSEQIPVPATVDLSKYIETRFFGERPHIRGRRLLVSMNFNF